MTAWTREDLSRWVHGIEATTKDEADDLTVMGIRSVAGEEQLAHAFHALAREVHPDRWRGTFGAVGTQRVVKAYSRLTLAYARLRDRFLLEHRRTARPSAGIAAVTPRPAGSTLPPRAAGNTLPPRAAGNTLPPRAAGNTLPPRAAGSTLPPRPASTSASGIRPRPASTDVDPAVRAQRVAGFRAAAEDALGRADLAAALLNLKLAVASDPTSAELRAELAEFEALLK